jgi:hypothetical protein
MKGIALGKSGFSRPMADKTPQLTTIGKAPVGSAESIFRVHLLYGIEPFLPAHRKGKKIGIKRPYEICGRIMDKIHVHFYKA